MKPHRFRNFSGIELRIIEDDIQNHLENDVVIFGKNKSVLNLIKHKTGAVPSLVDQCPLKITNYRTVNNDQARDFFSTSYHYTKKGKSRDFLIYKLIDRYFTNIMTALETNTKFYPEEWVQDSKDEPFYLSNRPKQSVVIMPLSWRNPKENSFALITAIWFISVCSIKHYYPFVCDIQTTPALITIVCDKGIDEILKVIESAEYADTKHISKFVDMMSQKRTRNEYLWKRIIS